MDLLQAFQYLLTPTPMMWLMIGVASGIFVGAIPGLGGGMLMALTVPLTFSMDSTHAILLLMGMHVGSVSGGLISATLLKMPGTPSAMMTTLDGYPMAQQGKPGLALSLGIGASFLGGLISAIFLIILAPPLATLALKFGPWEYFSMVLMALVLISSISQGTMLKGLLSAVLGITAALPGLNASDGQLRLTFGHESMTDGFNLLPVLLGIFVMSQLIKDTVELNKKATSISLKSSRLFPKLSTWKKHTINLFRSSIVGTWIGILPGVGASISSMVSYGMAKAFSKTPEKFGTGHEEGIVAAEAANNANAGGALIPLITMGIPGAPVDAILLGAMIMHRIQPGPLLFQTNGELVWALMGGYLVANILMFLVMLFSTRLVARIININRAYLVPIIFVFCVIGAYALSNRIFDVWLVLAFGVVGFFLDRAKFPLGPFVIGFVLTAFLEENLRSGLQLSDGSYMPLLTRPLSLVFVLVAVFFLILPFYNEWNRKRKQKAAG
ncbi:MAG: tripartite tricarboxylate transporter permease [Verrucomicrobia bacterium]|nr:tripartite tricarboxylate transporter permease [Verrucomicrobiota bacterium]